MKRKIYIERRDPKSPANLVSDTLGHLGIIHDANREHMFQFTHLLNLIENIGRDKVELMLTKFYLIREVQNFSPDAPDVDTDRSYYTSSHSIECGEVTIDVRAHWVVTGKNLPATYDGNGGNPPEYAEWELEYVQFNNKGIWANRPAMIRCINAAEKLEDLV